MTLFLNNKLIGTIAVMLSMLVLAISFMFASMDREHLAETTPMERTSVAQEAKETSPEITDDVLWLARVIYSETKRPYEQELVAWVVRNRVETRYNGVRKYEEAVLAPWQFSAFNRDAPKRAHYVGLDEDSQARGWQTAVAIAADVIAAPAYARPFAQTTRHFYSERSMVGRSAPAWANGQRPVALERQVDPRRFRFFSNIA